MKELVEYLVRSLVDDPDQVVVTAVDQGHTKVYRVEVAEGDLGQVIGRQGRIANALRTILSTVRTSDGTRHTLEIVS